MSKNVWEIFNEECPEVAEAYLKLSSAINKDGVLDDKTKNLILIGIYSTTRDPVALRHFTMMAFNTGVSSAELSIPLIKEVAEALKT